MTDRLAGDDRARLKRDVWRRVDRPGGCPWILVTDYRGGRQCERCGETIDGGVSAAVRADFELLHSLCEAPT